MKAFDEFAQLEKVIEKLAPFSDVETIANVTFKNQKYPLYVVRMGAKDPKVPTIGYFGGIHGLEKIGTSVLLSYMNTISEMMSWDKMLHSILKHVQFVFMPLVNPAGMAQTTRSNANGVDLMRNAPIDSEIIKWYQIYAGHRITKHLPWYRGSKNAPMEVESQAVCQVVQKYLFPSKLSLSLDVHSGFGNQDQIWFPYAHSRKPFEYFAQAYALKKLLDETYPSHIYRFEPQSLRYRSHGDLWDYLLAKHVQMGSENIFMPLTLELGSWNWMKKRPTEIFSLLGLFNPIKPHRKIRTLRRHLVFFDFLTRAMISCEPWATLSVNQQLAYYQKALSLWPLEQ